MKEKRSYSAYLREKHKIFNTRFYVLTGVLTFTLTCIYRIWRGTPWIETLLVSAVIAIITVGFHYSLVKFILRK